MFVNKCVCCSRLLPDKRAICPDCLKEVAAITGDTCIKCGREIHACTCVSDRKLMFDRNISCYRYSGGMQKTVLNFKFNGRTELCRFMSDEMAVLAAQRYDGIAFDAVTYVPMPRLRQAIRGYNQSQLLAGRIADRMGLPLVCTLKRKLTFDTQKKNSRTDRFTKIRNQFKVRGDVDGKTFLLVDDVITTGATLSECALTLKRAGAGQVFCVTFASTYKK